jgi:hypothetical protein
MTSPTKVETVVKSKVCPHCKDGKLAGALFCPRCMELLPNDLVHDLNSNEPYTLVAAYTDATLFLMNDWR